MVGKNKKANSLDRLRVATKFNFDTSPNPLDELLLDDGAISIYISMDIVIFVQLC